MGQTWVAGSVRILHIPKEIGLRAALLPCPKSPLPPLLAAAYWRTYDATMSYKALLFCPDERTARVVTQVLTELEFQVEPCNEPFAAVKKLMAEHFDAVVVDCDNEQNATLLFKSARNSGSNQTSLSVAVVEGQSGVAKAFRIGANLVLTKPINVEQSKGTLRVARGLLRKGETTKLSPPKTFAEPAPGAMETHSVPPQSAFKPASITSPAPPLAPAVTASTSSAFELEKEPAPEPEPAEAALLESMQDPTPPAATKQYPWQPTSKPMAEPMATALKRAAEAAGQAKSNEGLRSAAHSTFPATGPGSAAAAAPAKISPIDEEEADALEVPSFSTGIGSHPSSQSGSRKTILIVAVALVVLAAAYYGWTKFGGSALFATLHKVPVPAQAPAPTPPAVTPAEHNSVLIGSSNTSASGIPANGVPTAPQVRTPEKPSPITETPVSANNKKTPEAEAGDETESGVVKNIDEASDSGALLVKNNAPKSAPHHPASEAGEPEAPVTFDLAQNSTNQAISGLVSAPAHVPGRDHLVTVSQGVSQGLLIKKVPPEYPAQARQMRVQGAVQLVATISRQGDIENLKVLSGDAILARAAVEAVKQWKYKPYLLDSQPVEIQTQITVNFKLP